MNEDRDVEIVRGEWIRKAKCCDCGTRLQGEWKPHITCNHCSLQRSRIPADEWVGILKVRMRKGIIHKVDEEILKMAEEERLKAKSIVKEDNTFARMFFSSVRDGVGELNDACVNGFQGIPARLIEKHKNEIASEIGRGNENAILTVITEQESGWKVIFEDEEEVDYEKGNPVRINEERDKSNKN